MFQKCYECFEENQEVKLVFDSKQMLEFEHYNASLGYWYIHFHWGTFKASIGTY